MSDPTKAVFLSYAREDADAARRIAEALRSSGVEVWFDQNELRGGDTWDAKIRKQINDCTLFLPIISVHTQDRNKGYFRLEWKLAVEQTHLLLEGVPFLAPIVIDDTTESGAAVPAEFMRVQWTRLPGALPTPQFVGQVKRLLEAPKITGGPSSREAAADASSAASRELSPPKKPAVPGWTWGALTAVVVGIAVALSVSRKPVVASAPVAPAKSIAVLPFENRSENKADAFFTDGIHDDLLTQISRIRDIKTISRTSVMAYKGTSKNMRTIGEELGVATILEGGVQRAGNQVRINMQLIDARTDAHLWAETYTRELTAENIFAIQSEIAGAIAKELQVVLSPEDQKQLARSATTNLAALEKYFEANALVHEQNTDKLERAVTLYQEAIRLDDRFAPAYARLAGVYLDQIFYSGLPREEQTSKAEPLIEQALRLDPQLSEAYVARGWLLRYRSDIPGARVAYERAIELKPNNDTALLGLANLLIFHLYEGKKGLALGQRALELNPEDAAVKRSVALALAQMMMFSKSRDIAEKLARENPADAISLALIGEADCRSGKLLEGLVTMRKAYALDPGSAVIADKLLGVSLLLLGDKSWIDFWLNRCVAMTRVGKAPLDTRLRLLISQGRLEEADRLWHQEWQSDENGMHVVLWELMMADIKAGRNLAPKARWLKVAPALFVPGAKVGDRSADMFLAKDVALALTAAGERSQAEYLLASVATIIGSKTKERSSPLILAKVQLAQGDRTAFLQTLRALIDQKKFSADYLYIDPEFAVYREDTEFLALFGDLPRQRAELIATLHRMDANGEFAPIPPLPEVKK